MQSFVSFAAILAAAIRSTNAQTITVSLSDSAPSSSPTANVPICPARNGQTTADPYGALYQVYCGSYLVSSTFYIEDNSLSARQCMLACDERVGCLGAVWYKDGRCELATGDRITVRQAPGFDAFVAVNPTIASSTSLRPSSSAPALTTVMSPLPTGNASASCFFSNIDCPGCDGQIVLDDFGNFYNVTCDAAIFADGVYDVSRSTSPQGCMEQCDGYPWCVGATWHPEGNCELARFGNAAPIEMPGYTAFMSVPVTSTSFSRPTSVSWSTTFAAPSQGFPINSTTPSLTAPSTSQPTCDSSTVSCPSCEGSIVRDMLGQNYLTQCYIRPVCESTANLIGNYTAERCLERCDDDATCLAAIYTNGTCDLCQQDIVSIAAFRAPIPGFAVFLSPVIWQTEDPRLPFPSNTSILTQFIDTSVSTAVIATGTLSSVVSTEEPMMSILPFPALPEQSSLTTAEQTMSILPFPALEATSTTSDGIMSILPFPAFTSTSTDQVISILPFPALESTATTSEEIFSILPFPALSEQLTSTAPDGVMSILPFPPLSEQVPATTVDGTMSILPFPEYTATTTSEQIFSILPFPALSEQLASTSSDGVLSILPFPALSSPTPTISIASFDPVQYEPPTATDAMVYSLMPNVSMVSCPEDQNLAVYDDASNKAYQIKCDAQFQAAQHWTVSASDFAACAGLCTADCDGVQYYSRSCGLMTGITVLTYQRGATAAAVMQTAVSVTATFTASLTSSGTSLVVAAGQTGVAITRTFTA